MDCSESFLLTAIRVAKEAELAPPEAPPGWVPPCWQSPELFGTPRWDWDLNTNLYGNIGCQVSKRGIIYFLANINILNICSKEIILFCEKT